MYAKSTRPSAKRDDQIARPRRAQTCERSELRAMRMCPRSGQIFFYSFAFINQIILEKNNIFHSSSETLICIILINYLSIRKSIFFIRRTIRGILDSWFQVEKPSVPELMSIHPITGKKTFHIPWPPWNITWQTT